MCGGQRTASRSVFSFHSGWQNLNLVVRLSLGVLLPSQSPHWPHCFSFLPLKNKQSKEEIRRVDSKHGGQMYSGKRFSLVLYLGLLSLALGLLLMAAASLWTMKDIK